MFAETTHTDQYTGIQPHLYMAFELSQTKWMLGFTIGFGQRPRLRSIAARDRAALQNEIHLARERFELGGETPVISCYEAGRDGFWLHRYLSSIGVSNLVVDSASIEVNRRAKQAKTDKLDLGKLLTMLMRYQAGEKKVWRVIHVPSPEVEDHRHLHRELADLKAQRTQHTNRIKGYLANQGICLEVGNDLPELLEEQRLWNGDPLPAGLRARLLCEYERFQLVQQQVQVLEAERRETLRHSTQPEIEQVRRLLCLRGIGINCAWLYVMEFFCWRAFRNRREVGALAGLTPMPHRSGEEDHELGISKVGNRHIRAMAIEIAWGWLRYQPNSELSRWYQRRFGKGSKRLRKIGIVALARKLLIAIWRYLEFGTLPTGAVLKST
ncbi:MAG TPA: IS110 family transposase [Pyrinomonadaceae bacterium]|nr:IS110 family transposase [Pyrinomonadaceae bacterium]